MEMLSPSTQKLLQSVVGWYRHLQPRERWMLILLAGFVIAFGLYRGYQAYSMHVQNLNTQIEQAQDDLLWLEQSRIQVQNYRLQGVRDLDEQQLAEYIEQQAADLAIAIEMTNIATDVNNQPSITIQWKGNALSAFMNYLSALSQRGAHINAVEVLHVGTQFEASALLKG